MLITGLKMRSFRYYRDAFCPERYFAERLGEVQMPVFMFHDIVPDEFERQLSFLAENGYRAVSCVEAPWDDPDPKKVVLTFDDGLRSVWQIAFPFLKRYGFSATVFVSPALIGEGERTPTLDQVSAAELAVDDYGNRALFNWDEARALEESGVVDVQLHGYAHSRVFVSERIMDFARPSLDIRMMRNCAWQIRKATGDVFMRRLPPGHPIYENGSRWGTARRFMEDPGLSEGCVDLAACSEDFFERPDWRDQLMSFVARYRADHPGSGRMETDEEKREDLVRLLGRAGALLESKLGKKAAHFALPWAEGNPWINEAAAAAGIRHVYWEHILQGDIEEFSEGSIRHHARLKELFVRRLPGKGRQGLVDFLIREYRRNLEVQRRGG
jgi:peptidoglycan/xylan/chitin deacetylase (PgdA/CDA1 family)